MYPDDSLQNLIENWWVEDENTSYCRGRLIWSYVPHVDQIPLKLTAVGRSEPTVHDKALVRVETLRISEKQRQTDLPVAALTNYPNELHGVYRVKKRPLLIVSCGGDEIPKKLIHGKPKWQTAPTVLAAPYYGCDEGNNALWI